ncbi:MAG TPA: TonB-dependent receptor, partial [Gemmatimonadaceae bacterium]|nr:TonB-dependent receptor [Gemmatimonadaceae bacterium]
RFLGMDVGLERERSMNAAINVQPTLAVWMRPRLDLNATYTMVRDPNTRSLLRTGDSTGAFRLPRRLGNSQTVTAGTAIDVSRAIVAYTGDSSWMRRLTRTFQPFDLTWTRNLNSSFDGAPFTPGLDYQLALGGIDDFRRVGGRLASSASLRTDRTLSGGLSLPFGVALASRFQRTLDRGFQRLPDNTHQPTEGRSTSLPNLSLRWNLIPPRLLQPVVASVGTQLGYNSSRSSTRQAGVAGGPDQEREDRTRSLPVTASVTWAFAGNLSTAAGFKRSTSEGRQPGTINTGSSEEYSLDMARPFALPKEWNLSDQLNARVSYSRSRTENFVRGSASGTSTQSTLANYGRRSLNFNADTQMSENLTASLVFSRIKNVDYQRNQRTSQMVFSAVLQLQFFAGELR